MIVQRDRRRASLAGKTNLPTDVLALALFVLRLVPLCRRIAGRRARAVWPPPLSPVDEVAVSVRMTTDRFRDLLRRTGSRLRLLREKRSGEDDNESDGQGEAEERDESWRRSPNEVREETSLETDRNTRRILPGPHIRGEGMKCPTKRSMNAFYGRPGPRSTSKSRPTMRPTHG